MGWSPTKILYQTKEAEGFLFSRPLPLISRQGRPTARRSTAALRPCRRAHGPRARLRRVRGGPPRCVCVRARLRPFHPVCTGAPTLPPLVASRLRSLSPNTSSTAPHDRVRCGRVVGVDGVTLVRVDRVVGVGGSGGATLRAIRASSLQAASLTESLTDFDLSVHRRGPGASGGTHASTVTCAAGGRVGSSSGGRRG